MKTAILLQTTEIFGLGLLVYCAIIILGIPVYFICRWLLKKVVKSKKARIITTWGLTFLLTPILFVGFILLWFSFNFVKTDYPNLKFDKHSWLINKYIRNEYSENLIKSKMLIGKSKKEVRKILGDDNNSYTSDDWYYRLGAVPGITDVGGQDKLWVYFEKGKVKDVRQAHE